MGSEKKLTKKDLNKMAFRSILLNSTYNFERMQAVGFTYAMAPALDKTANNEEDRNTRYKNHLNFINSHSYAITLIMGICAALEEKKESTTLINSIKVALMGPLAGLGDSLVWFTVMPIIAGIGIQFAMQGNIVGPIIFFLAFNIIGFLIRFGFLHGGYKLGVGILDKIGDIGDKLSRGAGILGMTVVGGLVASYVSLTTILQIKSGEAVVNIQTDMLDAIMPKLLPALYTLFVFYLIRSKKKSPTMLIIITIIFCVVGSLLGFF
ncbi:MAG: PTS system mannose/fructose/sorbose family transporter subunit IID [Herbinix sp.]|nr:PTS system mannose/fructose/sorbose family transporter subunit IID [Herbinix sp.]